MPSPFLKTLTMAKRTTKKPIVKTAVITETSKPSGFVEVLITKSSHVMAYSVGKKYQVTHEEAQKLKDLGLV